eukprot:TRINITY_DN5650_c0_g1_i1.p1 TRINITY_DN5650_c0_g1~~TRINITY_DN5650_c0_g1_i1.p1  ORF type:complete len:941 (-),score=84.18 TRINITY_DN5650_c0_g1_i1:186-2957(-)
MAVCLLTYVYVVPSALLAFLGVAVATWDEEADVAASHALAFESATTDAANFAWESKTQTPSVKRPSVLGVQEWKAEDQEDGGSTRAENREKEVNAKEEDEHVEMEAEEGEEEPDWESRLDGRNDAAANIDSDAGALNQATYRLKHDDSRRRFSLRELVDGEVTYEGPRGWSRRRDRWRKQRLDESEVKLAPGIDDAIPEAVEHGDIAWTIAFMFLGAILVIVMLLHMFNWDQAYVRLSAYRVMVVAVAVVLAVIVNEAANVSLIHLLVGTILAGKVENSYHIIFGLLLFYLCFFLMSRLLHASRHHPVWLYACAILGSLITAIRGIFVFNAQSRQWESSGTNQGILVALVLFAFLVCASCCFLSHIWHTTRYGPVIAPQPEADGSVSGSVEQRLSRLEDGFNNKWRLALIEAEDRACTIIVAYLTFQAIAYAILGVVQPLNGYTITTEAHHVWYLLFVCFLLLVLFIVTIFLVSSPEMPLDPLGIESPTLRSRLFDALHVYFLLTLFFCLFRVGEWALMVVAPSYYSVMVVNAFIIFCLAALLIFLCQATSPETGKEEAMGSWAEDLDQPAYPIDDDLDSDLDDYDSDSEDDLDDMNAPRARRAYAPHDRLADRRARVAAMDPIERYERRQRIHARMSPEDYEDLCNQGRECVTIKAPAVTCEHCGNVYLSDSLYCRKCGKRRPVIQSHYIKPETHAEDMRKLRRAIRHRHRFADGHPKEWKHGHEPGHGPGYGPGPEHEPGNFPGRYEPGNFPTARHLFDLLSLFSEVRGVKVTRNVCFCTGVILGVAVMKPIHAATATIIFGNMILAEELPLALLIAFFLLCLVIIPVWFLYLVPGARKSVYDHKRIIELETLQWGSEFPPALATTSFLKASEPLHDHHLIDAITRLSMRRPLIRPYLQVRLGRRHTREAGPPSDHTDESD